MKRLIQGLLEPFGVELRRKSSSSDTATTPKEPTVLREPLILSQNSTSDPFITQKELITSSAPTIFDVGSHIGETTKRYRDLFPLASIYSFEPFPQSFDQLKQNTANDANIQAFNLAISDQKGVFALNSNTSSPTNSLLPTDIKGSFYWGDGLLETQYQVEANTTSIDSFCQENSISKIDILKLDIQGAEFIALTGSKEMLKNQAISLIYLEMIMAPTYQGQHKLHEYLSLLDSLGYELFNLYNPIDSRMQLIQADLLFISNTFKQKP